MPLERLALVSRDSWVPWGCNNRKDSPWQAITPRHKTNSRLKHTSSRFVKEAYLLVLELQPEGQDSGLAHI